MTAWAIKYLLQYRKQIAGLLAITIIVIAIDQHGANRVQARWDKAIVAAEQAKQKADAEDKAARLASAEQYRRDIENAKSQAGRAAVDKYIRDHGLLPACIPVPGAGGVAGNGSTGTDGTTGKPGTGEILAEFATACGKDALKVMRWQEFAIAHNFKVE
jgi:hypothetical protein